MVVLRMWNVLHHVASILVLVFGNSSDNRFDFITRMYKVCHEVIQWMVDLSGIELVLQLMNAWNS